MDIKFILLISILLIVGVAWTVYLFLSMKNSRAMDKREQAEKILVYHLEQAKKMRDTLGRLNRADTLEEAYSIAIRSIITVLDADRAAILLADSDDVVRFKAWEGLSPEYRQAVEGRSPWRKSDLDAQPIFITDITKTDLFKEFRAIVLKEGLCAGAFIPLVGRRQLLGKFMMYYNKPHAFKPDEVDVTRVIADNLATVIERLQSQEALQESEIKYRTLFEDSRDAIFVSSVDGSTFDFNKSAEELLGYSREELLSLSMEDIFADKKERIQFRKLIESQGYVKDYELKLRKKDGSVIDCLDSATVRRDMDGNIIGYQGIIRDITEQRRSLEALEKSEAFLDGVLSGIQDGICVLNTDFTIKYVNDVLKEWYPESPPLEGRKCYQCYHNTNQPCDPCPAKRCLESGNMEIEIVSGLSDSSVEWIELTSYPIKDTVTGAVTEIIEFARNITKRRKMEEALRESEKQYRTLVNEISDGIYIIDTQGIFTFTNEAHARILGVAGAMQLVGRNILDFVPPDRHNEVRETIKTAMETGDFPPIVEYPIRREDGSTGFIEIRAVVMKQKGKIAGIRGVATDVTERILARKKLVKALEEAKQGEKIKSLFMANMSHEIRTPLNAILGFTELIEGSARHLVCDDEKEFFDVVKKSGNRLMQTVHAIMDISQIEAGTYVPELEQLDLCKLVREVISECQLMADEKNLKLEYESEIDSAIIMADEDGLSQAINNIIDNGIKYTEKGGVKVSLKRVSGSYILSILDTGIGIAKEYKDNLFSAFTQESEGYTKKFQGLGLGMAITRHHLDLNKVDVKVESSKGVGTTFTLTFEPVAHPGYTKPVNNKKIEITPSTETADKPMILLVENDLNNLKILEIILKQKYETCSAVSVVEAKKQLRNYSIDLILLDFSLEGDEDGLDLVAYMKTKKELKDIPVIAVTAHAFSADRNNALQAGCTNYVSKPINRIKLLGMISEHCA